MATTQTTTTTIPGATSPATTILIMNGPNLNLLGTREPDIYGTKTLDEINAEISLQAEQHNVRLETFQSNHEGELIDQIQQAMGHVDFIIFNPAAYTHTSIALRDTLLAVAIPFIEVHLSDLAQRESFRQDSFLQDIAQQVISGHGSDGYRLALEAAISYCAK